MITVCKGCSDIEPLRGRLQSAQIRGFIKVECPAESTLLLREAGCRS